MNREEQIRQTAYELWKKEGCPEGRSFDHWLKAEAIWAQRHSQGASGIQVNPSAEEAGSQRKRTRRGPAQKT